MRSSSRSRCGRRRFSAGSRICPRPTRPIVFNLFGLLPFDPTQIPVFGPCLAIGIWPLIMGITMFIQMKVNPEPTDPVQKQVFTWMPVIFTFTLGSFAVRPCHLLELEQYFVGHSADGDHEAGRRQDRTLGQFDRHVPQESDDLSWRARRP